MISEMAQEDTVGFRMLKCNILYKTSIRGKLIEPIFNRLCSIMCDQQDASLEPSVTLKDIRIFVVSSISYRGQVVPKKLLSRHKRLAMTNSYPIQRAITHARRTELIQD